VAYLLVFGQSFGTPILLTRVGNQGLEKTLVSAENKEILQMSCQLEGSTEPPCYRLQPTASHISDLRVGIKFLFSSKIEINDGGERLNSRHGSSTHNRFPFCLRFFMYTYERT
jgi:hypothetical protein